MKNAKKNNKGFSLVELIVVVLIMAIIAVALAPQVMKWVDESRVSTDISNYDSLVANCQLALADEKAYAYVKNATSDITITYTGSNMTLSPEGTNDFYTAMDALDPSWRNLRTKESGATYSVKIEHGNAVVHRAEKNATP